MDSAIYILCLKHKILVLFIPNKWITLKDTSTQERELTHFTVLETNHCIHITDKLSWLFHAVQKQKRVLSALSGLIYCQLVRE